ncbi:hypothetical protein FML83_18695 [Bacillus thuringiensis]|nr:hypothetical protein [Bacillus thuringiensis]
MHYLAFNDLFRFIQMPITFFTYLSRYLWAVRPPPQNSAKAKKLGRALLIKVSLYSVSKTLQNKKIGIDNYISIPIFL